jgi:hypothetical protein
VAAAPIGLPQLVQKRIPGAFCIPQLAQNTEDDVLNAEPQCVQNAAPGFTSPLQRGQVVAEANGMVPAGVLLSCTGVPHCGQNFFPVTSLPQDVQVVII